LRFHRSTKGSEYRYSTPRTLAYPWRARPAALPEVAGEGAYLFDPYSVESIANALNVCLLDMDLREKLVKKGCENAARFSWQKVARETLAVYSATAS
jgi:glycosyltransferase involved in cell wall biosynthesis